MLRGVDDAVRNIFIAVRHKKDNCRIIRPSRSSWNALIFVLSIHVDMAFQQEQKDGESKRTICFVLRDVRPAK